MNSIDIFAPPKLCVECLVYGQCITVETCPFFFNTFFFGSCCCFTEHNTHQSLQIEFRFSSWKRRTRITIYTLISDQIMMLIFYRYFLFVLFSEIRDEPTYCEICARTDRLWFYCFEIDKSTNRQNHTKMIAFKKYFRFP